MMRLARWPLALIPSLFGCGPAPASPALPEDHAPTFVRDHRDEAGCERCHGADPCARCHQARPPDDHGAGFAGAPHAFAGRADPARCATCHDDALCARCHQAR